MGRISENYLSNNVKVITEELTDTNSSTIGLWVKCGSTSETKTNNGVSHFIEHLLFKGTKKRNAKMIASEIEGVGGILNAFTGREYTCFYSKVLNKDLNMAADLLTDMFLNSLFDAKELEKERMVVMQEISMVEDTPDDLVHDLFFEKFWQDSPYGRPILGTDKTLGNLKRESILDYFENNYTIDNLVICIAGGFKKKDILNILEKKFKRFKRQGTSPASDLPVQSRGSFVERKKLEQAHFCLGVKAIPQVSEDRFKLYLLNTILGSGMGSRLFQEVREKRGLAYSVFSYLSLLKETGSLVVYCGTGKKDFKKSVDVILKEVKKLKKTITKEELKSAKDQLKGGLLLSLETSDSKMMKLARDEIYYGNYQSSDSIIKNINKVTLDDVGEMCDKLFKRNPWTLSVVGDVKEKDLPF